MASFIARTLRENAYAVDVADTCEKGLELGKQTSYDAIRVSAKNEGGDEASVHHVSVSAAMTSGRPT